MSSLDDFSTGNFKEVIDDENVITEEVRRVVFSTGKIYYDLLTKKEDYNAKDIALIRIEQLHPWPEKQIQKIIEKYPNTKRWIWAQEEPENMGSWRYVNEKFNMNNLQVVARQASGSPAVGLNKLHLLGQEEIIGKIFRKCTCERKNKYCGLQCQKGSERIEIRKQHTYL